MSTCLNAHCSRIVYKTKFSLFIWLLLILICVQSYSQCSRQVKIFITNNESTNICFSIDNAVVTGWAKLMTFLVNSPQFRGYAIQNFVSHWFTDIWTWRKSNRRVLGCIIARSHRAIETVAIILQFHGISVIDTKSKHIYGFPRSQEHTNHVHSCLIELHIFQSSNWNSGEPSHYSEATGHCAKIISGFSGLWDNVPCSDDAEVHICERGTSLLGIIFPSCSWQ